MLIVPKKDSLRRKTVNCVLCTFNLFMWRNNHRKYTFVGFKITSSRCKRKKFYFVLFDRSPPDSSKLQEVSYGHTCPILQGVSPSLSIYGFTLLFIHLPAYLHQKNKRRKLKYHIFYLTTVHHIHISDIYFSC